MFEVEKERTFLKGRGEGGQALYLIKAPLPNFQLIHLIWFRKPAEELFDDLLFERNDKDKDKEPKSPAKSVKSHSPPLSPKMRECSISPRIKIPPLSPRKEAKNEPSISPRAKDVDVGQKTKIKVGWFCDFRLLSQINIQYKNQLCFPFYGTFIKNVKK